MIVPRAIFAVSRQHVGAGCKLHTYLMRSARVKQHSAKSEHSAIMLALRDSLGEDDA